MRLPTLNSEEHQKLKEIKIQELRLYAKGDDYLDLDKYDDAQLIRLWEEFSTCYAAGFLSVTLSRAEDFKAWMIERDNEFKKSLRFDYGGDRKLLICIPPSLFIKVEPV